MAPTNEKHENTGQRKLYVLSGERFEDKVQLNWPCCFNQNYYYGYRDILGFAVNGTLCIDHYRTIVLWNPATEELNIVPQNNARFKNRFIIHGFGYDEIRDDYKIIQRVEYMGDYLQVEPFVPYWDIYSLKSNSWKKLYVDMQNCYWRSGETNSESYVVSFNLSNEIPVTTLIPVDLHDLGWVNRHLEVLNGHVAMISNCVKTTSFHISISILGELGVKESWTKLFDVGPLSDIKHPIDLIGAWKKGDILFRNDDNELFCLDLTTGAIEKTGVKTGSQVLALKIYDHSD
ncbi:F-box protein interaction domain protein [Medicago truncatula]|uniref:F-box protein interaction domain protein n=1 Tax=Medicago truncatula TaxID=3880 RepID=A0A072VH99_MEDTR|nr:F-box protein interaction domain protein [Medicago truncatula]